MLLVPHRSETPDEAALPGDYRKILVIVRAADGPVQVRGVVEEPGGGDGARQAGAFAREVDQTRRPWLAAQATRRRVHRTPIAAQDKYESGLTDGTPAAVEFGVKENDHAVEGPDGPMWTSCFRRQHRPLS
ncbi:hypothetical protein GCM10020367_72200 [Streptomyces sannanensis]|uniref:Uncharacterized protein n=1 Tax=Streptomyces sannanensis TaxID=285536 RepID=A0ABP6SNL3_9ACTN